MPCKKFYNYIYRQSNKIPITTFSYIWEYFVKEEYIDAFEHQYGPNGDWVRLFKQSDDYLGTELYQDTLNPLRFITVDRWTSKEARDRFQKQFQSAYREVDKACEAFTHSENFIGDFKTFH